MNDNNRNLWPPCEVIPRFLVDVNLVPRARAHFKVSGIEMRTKRNLRSSGEDEGPRKRLRSSNADALKPTKVRKNIS